MRGGKPSQLLKQTRNPIGEHAKQRQQPPLTAGPAATATVGSRLTQSSVAVANDADSRGTSRAPAAIVLIGLKVYSVRLADFGVDGNFSIDFRLYSSWLADEQPAAPHPPVQLAEEAAATSGCASIPWRPHIALMNLSGSPEVVDETLLNVRRVPLPAKLHEQMLAARATAPADGAARLLLAALPARQQQPGSRWTDVVPHGSQAPVRERDGVVMVAMANQSVRMRVQLSASFDLRAFPCDHQLLPILLQAPKTRDKHAILAPMPYRCSAAAVYEANAATSLPGCQLGPPGVQVGLSSHISVTRSAPKPQLRFTMPLVREPWHYLRNIALLLHMLVVAGFVGAIGLSPAPSQLAERLGLTVTLLLTAVAFQLVIRDKLPAVNKSTLLDRYAMSCLMVLVGLLAEQVAAALVCERLLGGPSAILIATSGLSAPTVDLDLGPGAVEALGRLVSWERAALGIAGAIWLGSPVVWLWGHRDTLWGRASSASASAFSSSAPVDWQPRG